VRWPVAGDDPQLALFGEQHRDLPQVEYLPVNARRIVNEVPAASRMPFRYTINAYRGCRHACTYCFARPTHAYLDLGIGEDFERKIVVKVNAVERLRVELADPAWGGDLIAMGTNTDPYQPAEGRYRLTQGLIEVLAERRNPFSILTKSSMILRDEDLLVHAAGRTDVSLAFSIGTVDDDVTRLTEPGAAPPSQRLAAVARLAELGFEPTVLVAPVLPGISDSRAQLEAVGRACAEAGAARVTAIPLHLRPGVREHYLGWLQEARPELMEEHLRRFGDRAYQPKAEGARIGEIVKAAFRAGRLRARRSA
jgi:DNA repair photolyase